MIHVTTPPIPGVWVAQDDQDDAELFPAVTGKSRQDAIENYYIQCIENDPDYTSDSPEFAEFIESY